MTEEGIGVRPLELQAGVCLLSNTVSHLILSQVTKRFGFSEWKSASKYYSLALFHVCFFTWFAWNWSELIYFTVPVTQPLGLEYSLYSLKLSWYRQWWLCFHHLEEYISDNCLIPRLWFHCLQFFRWDAAQLYHVLVQPENFQLTHLQVQTFS